MRSTRLAIAAIAVVLTSACGLFEPNPAEMLAAGAAKLRAARTVHLEGTGSFGLKDGLSFTFDFTLDGDASIPDNTAKITVSAKVLGQTIKTESISVGGKSYTKDATTGVWRETGSATGTPGLDPLGNSDLTGVTNVVEVDRPLVDGKQTRHFTYAVDPDKLKDAMTKTQSAAPSFKVSDVKGGGEIWIHTDDQNIVRQMVKLSFSMTGVGLVPGATGPTSATIEVNMDLKFSKHGEPIPAITAPPVRR